MNGSDLRKLAESAGVGPMEICQEANIKSPSTLYKVYNGVRVRATNRSKIEQAIKRLAAKAKAVAI